MNDNIDSDDKNISSIKMFYIVEKVQTGGMGYNINIRYIEQ